MDSMCPIMHVCTHHEFSLSETEIYDERKVNSAADQPTK
jgi:hypothetical protein